MVERAPEVMCKETHFLYTLQDPQSKRTGADGIKRVPSVLQLLLSALCTLCSNSGLW